MYTNTNDPEEMQKRYVQYPSVAAHKSLQWWKLPLAMAERPVIHSTDDFPTLAKYSSYFETVQKLLFQFCCQLFVL